MKQRTRRRPDRASQRMTAGPHGYNTSTFSATDVADPGAPQAVPLGLPADLLDNDEIIILLLRPSVLFILLAPLGTLLGIAALAVLLALVARTGWVPWADVQALAVGGTVLALRIGWQMLDWGTRLYVLTDKRIIRRMGVLRDDSFDVPLSNVQHTEVVARFRERIFGLGSLGFATSGTVGAGAYWQTIRQPYQVRKIVNEAIDRYGHRPHA